MTSPQKVALVTGASSGIGEHFARRLARDGWHVAICARREQRLRDLAAQLSQQHGAPVTVLPADLATPAGVANLWAAMQGAGIEIPDLLVNNAGFGRLQPFVDTEHAPAMEMVGLNVQAVVDLTQRAVPGMVARRRGAVINVASTAAFQPVPLYAVYGATKAFVVNFSLALSLELEGTGVQVQALCPGATRTEFGRVAGVDPSAEKLGFMEPQDVVDASLAALESGRVVCVPGAVNKISVLGAKLSPSLLSGRLAGTIMRRVRSPSR
jgi:hypothetical protein